MTSNLAPLLTFIYFERWNIANHKKNTRDVLPMLQYKFVYMGWNHLRSHCMNQMFLISVYIYIKTFFLNNLVRDKFLLVYLAHLKSFSIHCHNFVLEIEMLHHQLQLIEEIKCERINKRLKILL